MLVQQTVTDMPTACHSEAFWGYFQLVADRVKLAKRSEMPSQGSFIHPVDGRMLHEVLDRIENCGECLDHFARSWISPQSTKTLNESSLVLKHFVESNGCRQGGFSSTVAALAYHNFYPALEHAKKCHHCSRRLDALNVWAQLKD